jgi:hypothetical protein
LVRNKIIIKITTLRKANIHIILDFEARSQNFHCRQFIVKFDQVKFGKKKGKTAVSAMGIPIFVEDDFERAGTLHTTPKQKSNSDHPSRHPTSSDGWPRRGLRGIHDWVERCTSLWHVRARVSGFFLCSNLGIPDKLVETQVLGGGGEIFFPFPPTFSSRRPEVMFILNLRTDPNSTWDQELPPNWRDVELRISSSRDFQEEFLVDKVERRSDFCRFQRVLKSPK